MKLKFVHRRNRIENDMNPTAFRTLHIVLTRVLLRQLAKVRAVVSVQIRVMHAPAATPVDPPRLVPALADHAPPTTSGTAVAAAADTTRARASIGGITIVLEVAIVAVDGESANVVVLVVPAAVARVRVVIAAESLLFADRRICCVQSEDRAEGVIIILFYRSCLEALVRQQRGILCVSRGSSCRYPSSLD